MTEDVTDWVSARQHITVRFEDCLSVDLCSVVDADLNKSSLLVVEDTVMSKLPVSVVVELHASCEAFWVF